MTIHGDRLEAGRAMSPRPLWRWWLFCALLALEQRTSWDWARRGWAWCILPRWMATDDEIAEATHGVRQEGSW